MTSKSTEKIATTQVDIPADQDAQEETADLPCRIEEVRPRAADGGAKSSAGSRWNPAPVRPQQHTDGHFAPRASDTAKSMDTAHLFQEDLKNPTLAAISEKNRSETPIGAVHNERRDLCIEPCFRRPVRRSGPSATPIAALFRSIHQYPRLRPRRLLSGPERRHNANFGRDICFRPRTRPCPHRSLDRARGIDAVRRTLERPSQGRRKATAHINERLSGSFRRVVSLSDDIDPESATASYKDGVLHISIKRRAAAIPRRIDIH